MTDADVDAVVERYVDGVVERNPQVATVLGVHDHDGAVPSADADAVEREIAAATDALEALSGATGWTARVARAALAHDVHEMDELERWRSDPDAVDGIASLLSPLYLRDFAPFPERLGLIADRLEDCPGYVEDVIDRVDDPVALWIEDERRAVEELPGLLRLLADEAGDLERQDVAYRLNAAVGDVLEALEGYDDWLDGLDARDDWRIGADAYGALLEHRRLPSPDEIAETAEEALERADEALGEAVAALDVEDPHEAAERVADDHPGSPDAVVDAYVERAGELRDRLREDGTVPLPEDGGVAVTETPDHLTAMVPETGYVPPAPAAPEETPRYYVTTPDGEEGLRRHGRGAITVSVVRDLFPGHHLQRVHEAATWPSVPVVSGQFTAFGDDLVEGWRGYAERLMRDAGVGGDGFRLVAARNAVERAARARVDVALHTGAMSMREAASFLADEVGVDRGAAVADVRGMTRTPGDAAAALVGERRLWRLRERALDAGVDERTFHERVLGAGRAPVAMLEDRVLEE